MCTRAPGTRKAGTWSAIHLKWLQRPWLLAGAPTDPGGQGSWRGVESASARRGANRSTEDLEETQKTENMIFNNINIHFIFITLDL